MGAWVYPVISHWIWATGGWLSAFTDQDKTLFGSADSPACGMLDFAGSGVVHMTGGVAAFWGALIIGPRLGRWEEGAKFESHNYALTTLGTFILWFGWYGFNCGSTLVWEAEITSKVAVTTTLAPSAAAVTGTLVMYILTRKWDLGTALNCVLGGLVSIAGAKLMVMIGVDDPVNAIAVHGICGVWGVLSVGIFATEEAIFNAYSERVCDNQGEIFASQVVGVLAIFAWVSAFMIPTFLGLKFAGVLRVPEEIERAGLDISEHGGATYEAPTDK